MEAGERGDGERTEVITPDNGSRLARKWLENESKTTRFGRGEDSEPMNGGMNATMLRM